MNKAQIQQLVNKYFEANTSLAEENELREYFARNKEIDADLLAVQQQLELFEAGRLLPVDKNNLETEVIRKIQEDQPGIPKLSKNRTLQRWLFAASFLLFVFAGIMFLKYKDNELKDTYSDPAIAYIETQKALLLVSQKMNKGIEPLSNINKINTSTQQLKNLNKIDKSMEMLNLVSFINQSSNLKK